MTSLDTTSLNSGPMHDSSDGAPLRKTTATGVFLRRFLRQRAAVVCTLILLLLVAAAFIGPYLWPFGYQDIAAGPLQAPSAQHPFGTDSVGHDMFALALRGTQRSITVAIVVAVLSTIIGTIVGMIAGYTGGIVETILMRMTDLVLMLPLIAVLGLVAVRLGGNSNGWLIVSVAISLLYWTPTARVIKSTVQTLRTSDFAEAAKLLGANTPRILIRHMLPHLVGPLAVVTTTYVAAAIALEATLSFLGLGVQPPDTSLGVLMRTGVNAAATSWWLFYIPGAIILSIVLLVHFIGDGVQAAFQRETGGH